jgi:hypothetical protein
MDGSGCKAPFAESEIRRFLEPKMFSAFDNLRTANEICEVRVSNQGIELIRLQ